MVLPDVTGVHVGEAIVDVELIDELVEEEVDESDVDEEDTEAEVEFELEVPDAPLEFGGAETAVVDEVVAVVELAPIP